MTDTPHDEVMLHDPGEALDPLADAEDEAAIDAALHPALPRGGAGERT